eukprot:294830-Pelagomonas_calceolata.AAC.2
MQCANFWTQVIRTSTHNCYHIQAAGSAQKALHALPTNLAMPIQTNQSQGVHAFNPLGVPKQNCGDLTRALFIFRSDDSSDISTPGPTYRQPPPEAGALTSEGTQLGLMLQRAAVSR